MARRCGAGVTAPPFVVDHGTTEPPGQVISDARRYRTAGTGGFAQPPRREECR